MGYNLLKNIKNPFGSHKNVFRRGKNPFFSRNNRLPMRNNPFGRGKIIPSEGVNKAKVRDIMFSKGIIGAVERVLFSLNHKNKRTKIIILAFAILFSLFLISNGFGQ